MIKRKTKQAYQTISKTATGYIKPNGGNQESSFDEDMDQYQTTTSDKGKNLARTKLTQKDYMKRAQTAQIKKGKYGVTVPKPFAFDLRDKTKAKTIRERKVEEMIREK